MSERNRKGFGLSLHPVARARIMRTAEDYVRTGVGLMESPATEEEIQGAIEKVARALAELMPMTRPRAAVAPAETAPRTGARR